MHRKYSTIHQVTTINGNKGMYNIQTFGVGVPSEGIELMEQPTAFLESQHREAWSGNVLSVRTICFQRYRI